MTKRYRLFYFLFAPIIRLIYRIKVIGRENEPTCGRYLVLSNHISAADPVVICASMRHQVCYMGKKELFKIPGLAFLLRTLGAFPVDRGGADVGAVKNSIKLLKEGKWVGMFPQGTRHPGEDPRNTAVKTGASMIANRSGADILPVYIHRKDNKPKLFRKTVVIIGKPIPFSSYNYDNEASGEYQRIANEIFDVICKLGEEYQK